MEWIFAALSVAALVYSGGIVVDYLNHTTSICPRIKKLEDGVADLNLESNAEHELLEDVDERVTNLKSLVNDLRRQTVEMRDRLKAERERKRRLEVAVFRKRLRSRESLATA